MPRTVKWREDEWTKCPFYLRDAAGVIVCESPSEYPECKCALYVTPDNKRKLMETYCRGEYCECPIHKDILKKYN